MSLSYGQEGWQQFETVFQYLLGWFVDIVETLHFSYPKPVVCVPKTHQTISKVLSQDELENGNVGFQIINGLQNCTASI